MSSRTLSPASKTLEATPKYLPLPKAINTGKAEVVPIPLAKPPAYGVPVPHWIVIHTTKERDRNAGHYLLANDRKRYVVIIDKGKLQLPNDSYARRRTYGNEADYYFETGSLQMTIEAGGSVTYGPISGSTTPRGRSRSRTPVASASSSQPVRGAIPPPRSLSASSATSQKSVRGRLV